MSSKSLHLKMYWPSKGNPKLNGNQLKSRIKALTFLAYYHLEKMI